MFWLNYSFIYECYEILICINKLNLHQLIVYTPSYDPTSFFLNISDKTKSRMSALNVIRLHYTYSQCQGYMYHNVKVTLIPLLWPQWLLHTSAEVQRPWFCSSCRQYEVGWIHSETTDTCVYLIGPLQYSIISKNFLSG